jgi:hypothetical protein
VRARAERKWLQKHTKIRAWRFAEDDDGRPVFLRFSLYDPSRWVSTKIDAFKNPVSTQGESA